MRTTIPFHQWLVCQPAFVAGDFSTDFIAEEWHPEDTSGDGVPPSRCRIPAGGEVGPELTAEEIAVLVATLVTEAADQAATGRRGAECGGRARPGSRWRTSGGEAQWRLVESRHGG